MLRITHTWQDGTMLEGTSKGDGAWDAIKAAQKAYRIRGWKYFPSICAIGVSHSRDKAPALGNIDVTADALREAGFEVEVEVDTTVRAMEESEADRAEHMDDRADYLRGKAERRTAEADARWKAAQEIAEGIPMGQPILAGHHSERGHRRDLKRMDSNQRASLLLEAEAEDAARNAASAEKHMQHRENPRTTMRRIKKMEADRRRAQRAVEGHTRNFRDNAGNIYMQDVTKPAEGRYLEQLGLEIADLDEKIRYWQAHVDGEIAAGRFNPVDLSAIEPGDEIAYWDGWREVVRVNRTTVTVKTDHSWTQKAKVDEIRGHRKPTPAEDTVDLDAVEVPQ